MEKPNQNKSLPSIAKSTRAQSPRENRLFLEECIYFTMAYLVTKREDFLVKVVSRLQILQQQHLRFGDYEVTEPANSEE